METVESAFVLQYGACTHAASTVVLFVSSVKPLIQGSKDAMVNLEPTPCRLVHTSVNS